MLVAALGLEHHITGTAVPLLILSDVPGLLRWEPMDDLCVHDDVGTAYAVAGVARQSALGALAVTAWIVPGTPAEARALTLEVAGVHRVSVPRGGSGIEREFSGGPWTLELPLRPARTVADIPDDPGRDARLAGDLTIPPRTMDAYRGIIPVGQARVRPGSAVSVQAIERYTDRAVLSFAVLHDAPLGGDPVVELWDSAARHEVRPLHCVAREGWTEGAVTIRPAIALGARVLGVRITPPGTEPAEFGVAVPG